MAARRKQRKFVFTPGYFISGVLVVLLAAFLRVIGGTGMVPPKYLILSFSLLLALVAVACYLAWDFDFRGRFWAGLALSVVLAVVLTAGIVMGMRVQTLLDNVTTPDKKVVDLGIFVRADDPVSSPEELKGRSFGVLSQVEQEETDRYMQELETLLQEPVSAAKYDSPLQLIDDLLNGRLDAAVFNLAYLDLVDELEGYEDIRDRIRQVTLVTVEVPVTPAPASTPGPAEDDPVFTVYISGIDGYRGLETYCRSDVNIIAVVNPEKHFVLLVSTPRDYFLPLPISNGERDRLTNAGLFGVDVSEGTLEMLYGIHLDYYFRLDFSGFKRIIDSLGGVTVYSEKAFTAGDYSFSEGENTLDGEAALMFARERHAFKDGDLQRGRNQMALIKGVMKKVLSSDLLAKYMPLMSAVEGSFETTVPPDMIARLVQEQLDQGGDWTVETYHVSGTDGNETTFSVSVKDYVMFPDEDTVAVAKDLLTQALAGQVVTPP